MRTIVFLVALLTLSACSTREYHLFQLTDTFQSSRQTYHINKVLEIDGMRPDATPQAFQLGMGAFTTSTR